MDTNGTYYYVGNCVNSFDEDGECLLPIFNDVSDFACALENCETITKKDFQKKTGIVDIEFDEYLYHTDKNVIISYNEDTDIHSFYTQIA